MRYKRESFRKRIFIPIMIVFVLSVLAFSLINYRLLDSAVKKKADENLKIFMDSILAQNKHLDIILDSTKEILNKKHVAIAKSIVYILDNMQVDITPEILQSLAEPLDIGELSVVGADGILAHCNLEGYVGFDYRSTELTAVYMPLADGTITELCEEPRLSVLDDYESGSLNHYTGASRANGNGFIQLGFNADVLRKLQEEINIEITIKETKLGDNGYGIFISDGTISAHADTAMAGADVSDTDWYKAVSRGNGYSWINIDNKNYYAGYKNDGGNTVMGLIPEADYYKERKQIMIETMIFLSVAVVVMLVVLYVITGRLVAPIKKLSEGLGKIAGGDLSVPLTTDGNDEISCLSRDLTVVVNQFMSFADDISLMSHEMHINGDIDYQIDTGAYNGDYRKVIESFNDMTAATNAELWEIMKAFTALSKGEYGTGLRLFPGKKAGVNESFDLVRANLKARELIVSGINYASKIQKNLLPPEHIFSEAFSDYSVIWEPKDIVGGDIYWIKNFAEGTVLCVCDCTGHGTPGALLTMLVVSIFENTVNESNYKDTAGIIWELDKRLVSTLKVDIQKNNSGRRGIRYNDGCDLAVVYLAKDGTVEISSGNTNVFVCDGDKVERIKGQRIRVGDGAIKDKSEIKVVSVPVGDNISRKFYIASDGLYDQIGGDEKIPFGYDIFEQIILENHNENQSAISKKIWRAFEEYRADNPRRDDFELISFKPRII